jgi:hypothetical protein
MRHVCATREGYEDDLRDAWLAEYVEEELRHLSEAPAIEFLAHNGDAIEERVLACLDEVLAAMH